MRRQVNKEKRILIREMHQTQFLRRIEEWKS